MIKVGVIGLGTRIHLGVMPELYRYSDEFSVVAVADPDEEGVRKKISTTPKDYPDDINAMYAENMRFYKDADEMLEKEELDAVLVGTRCSLHTELAIKVMERGLPLFLEKPVSTNMEDLKRLAEANKKYNPKVVVSFPLRYSALSVLAKELIDSGAIGDVLQVDAFNDVPYGRVYFHDWYRDESETGGLWLQKATHDFDYINYILDDEAEEVFARNRKTLFKGNMPAGLKCADCDKQDTCPESPKVIKNKYQDNVIGKYCCFAVDTGNEDCGSALVKYKKGTVVSYSQNFFARHKAARRGARFYGYKGTLEFDWYKSEVKIYHHDSPRVETHTFNDDSGSHFGGDIKLAECFYKLIKGETDKSYLSEGIKSAYLCLSAKESCEKNENIIIPKL